MVKKTLAMALLLIVACDGGTTPEPLIPATVLVSPGEAALRISTDTVRLTATVKDQNGDTMDDVPVSWLSEDTVVATVNSGGVVSPAGNGVVEILATVDTVAGSASITVELDVQREALVALYESLNGDDWVRNDNWVTGAPLDEWYGITVRAGNVSGISMTYNDVVGTIPPEIALLEHLEILDLGFNEGVRGDMPPEIGKLKKMRHLLLHHNDMTGPIPAEYAELSELATIDFHFNDLHGPLPDWIGTLENLTVLSIHLIPLTGRLPRTLLDLDLTVFFWHDTELCAPADDEFQEWLDAIPNHSPGENCSS